MYNCYTSYISNKKIEHKDGFKIPICNKIYVWKNYSDHYSELAPDYKWVKWIHDQSEITNEHKDKFTKVYLLKLDSLKENKVLDKYVDDIRNRLLYDDIFLLCYELPDKFCHRHILSKYLNDNYDLDIHEY